MKSNRMLRAGLGAALALATLGLVDTRAPAAAQGTDPDPPSMAEHGGRVHRGFGMRESRRMGRFERRHELMRELDLTAEQRDKIADLHDRQARKVIGMRSEIRIAGLDLRKLLRAEQPNRVAIDGQIDKIAKLRADLRKAQVGTMLEIRAVLTPEQRKKLRDRMMGEEG